MLADTDLTVADVAHRVGYLDGGYFARRFRAAHGVPPAAWRRAGRPTLAPPYGVNSRGSTGTSRTPEPSRSTDRPPHR